MRRKIFGVTITVMIFLLIFQTSIVISNPIPLDDDYETSPISPRYGNAISFTKESIKVTFDSTMAYFKANYTFKNTLTIAKNKTIFLPMKEYKGPKDLILQKDQTDLDYKWKDITIQLDEDSSSEWLFRALRFTLSFAPEEECEVNVQYSRPYSIYDYSGNSEVHYSFKYLVGTARAWKQSLKFAYFEFWIPDALCDEDSINLYGTGVHSFEIDSYRVFSVSFEDWTPEEDYLSLYWTRSKPFGGVFSSFEPFSLISGFLVVIFFIRRMRKQ